MGEPEGGQPPKTASPGDPEVEPEAGRTPDPAEALGAPFDAAGDAIVRADREQLVDGWRFVDHLAALQSLTGTGFQELAESIVALVVASLGAAGG